MTFFLCGAQDTWADSSTSCIISVEGTPRTTSHLWYLGGPGKDCDDVCSYHGGSCDESMLKSFDGINIHANETVRWAEARAWAQTVASSLGVTCESWRFQEDVLLGSPGRSQSGQCFYSSESYSYNEALEDGYQRFCPCRIDPE